LHRTPSDYSDDATFSGNDALGIFEFRRQVYPGFDQFVAGDDCRSEPDFQSECGTASRTGTRNFHCPWFGRASVAKTFCHFLSQGFDFFEAFGEEPFLRSENGGCPGWAEQGIFHVAGQANFKISGQG